MDEFMSPESTEDRLPEELAKRLRRDSAPPFGVSEATDRQVIAAAREILTDRTSTVRAGIPRWRRRWLGAATVVSTLALLMILLTRHPPQDGAAQRQAATPERQESMAGAVPLRKATQDDVDGDGRVDILDAFALARFLNAGVPAPSGQDRDHDGAVTQNDVDLLASSIVTL